MKKRVLCILMAMAVSVGGVSIPAYANEGYGVEEVGVATENEEVTEESVSSNNVQTVSTNDLEADTTDDVYAADVDELEADEAEVETVDIKDVQKIKFQEDFGDYAEYNYKYDPTVIEKGNIDCSDGSLTYKVYDNGLRMIIEGNGTLKNVKSLQDKLIKNYRGYNNIQELRIVGKMKLPKDSSYLFHYPDNNYYSTQLPNLSSWLNIIGFENMDTSDVENMSYMFFTSYNLDLSTWNTSKVTNMQGMFSQCRGSIIFGKNFDTSNVTDMSHMFDRYKFDNIDLSRFNTYNVKDMSYMFWSIGAKYIDLSSFDTYNVKDMSHMFEAAYNLKEIKNQKFRTRPGLDINIDYMFANSTIEKVDLSGIDITNGKAYATFKMCYGLKEVKLFKCFPERGTYKHAESIFDATSDKVKLIYPVANGKTWRYVYGKYSDYSDDTYTRIAKDKEILDRAVIGSVKYRTFDIKDLSKTKTKTIDKVKYTFLILDKNNVGIKKIKTNKKNVAIPSKVKIGKKTYKVTYLSDNTFEDNSDSVEKISIPYTIKKIPYKMAYNCNWLEEIVIGKNVKEIEPNAFMWTDLKKITFKGTKVKNIGTSAFKGVSKKIVVKAPKSKLKAYKKMIKASK